MDVDIHSDFPHDQPLRSEPETLHGDDDDPPVIRRRRALDDQVEKVTDETGEMVRGAFLQFLETYFRFENEQLTLASMMNLIPRLLSNLPPHI